MKFLIYRTSNRSFFKPELPIKEAIFVSKELDLCDEPMYIFEFECSTLEELLKIVDRKQIILKKFNPDDYMFLKDFVGYDYVIEIYDTYRE